GSEAIQLTDFANPASGGLWSPDGKRLAVTANESADLRNADIYVVSADGSPCQRVLNVKDGSKDRPVAWLPDGARLAITSDASGVNRPGILDLSSDTVTWLGHEGVEESAASNSENGNLLATLRNQDAAITVVIHNLDTGSETIMGSEVGLSVWPDFALDDTLLVLAKASATRHRELLTIELATGQETVLTPVDYGSVDTAAFVESEHIRYESSDGVSIPAILSTPADLPQDAKAPAIVIVHGGPTGQFFRGFDPFVQVLADRGYVVLQPNIRGSTGYGVEFRDMNLNDWGGGDLEDVTAGVEYLTSLGTIDPDRVAVFGGSYGGYMTFMAVVKKPDLWKAGIAWIGITDLHRLYDKSMEHFKYYLRTLMGDPQENADLWKDRSAINFVENVNAKLLILHGVNDPRCPVEQSRIFRDRMLELGYKEGADFEYIEFADVGHASSDIGQKTETFKLIADFLDRTV
ncbi:S9 family peptidase, partial [Candidatus Bipolaricaulota bacterium]|nr:S9 family peptidase [Candidatus Bipolaricaulota bacterium]